MSIAAAVSSSTMLVATIMAGTSSSVVFAVVLTITIAVSEAICWIQKKYNVECHHVYPASQF